MLALAPAVLAAASVKTTMPQGTSARLGITRWMKVGGPKLHCKWWS
jgi:hypothetical protein